MMRRWWWGIALLGYGGVCAGAEACKDVLDPDGLSTLCGFAKPEDVQFIRSRAGVIVSEQGWKAPESGGSISFVPVDARSVRLREKRVLWPRDGAKRGRLIGDPSCTEPPSPTASSPHGLAALDGRTSTKIAIVIHGAAREAIELFDLHNVGDDIELEWQGCVPLPTDTAGNDVAIHPDGRLFVTNYCPSVHDARGVFAIIRAMRGEVTGDVMEWAPKRGWRHLPGTEGSMPNGLVLDDKGTKLYVSELGKQRVLEYQLDGEQVTRTGEFSVPVMADNLNWTVRRTLLVAGQLRENNKAWGVSVIDPKARTVTPLFEKQTAIHSVTAATDIGTGIVFGSTADERIAVARWPRKIEVTSDQ